MKKNTKHQLLSKGMEIFNRRGFHPTGLQQILEETGVPKGSFYHFFKSKEDFGLQVLDAYGVIQNQRAQAVFLDQAFPHIIRLQRYFTEAFQDMANGGFCGGCLIGNLTQELADSSSVFASRLEAQWRCLEVWITRCLYDAQASGEIERKFKPESLAAVLINGWQGVIMRSKLAKSDQPFRSFFQVMFGDYLKLSPELISYSNSISQLANGQSREWSS